jgi:DNA-directed RNA polymerase subunit alpha
MSSPVTPPPPPVVEIPLDVKEAEKELERMTEDLEPDQRKAEREKLNRPLAEIGFSVRTTNGLEEAGIYTVGVLLMCKEEWLLSIPNIGEKTLEEIYKGLASAGYYREGHKPTESEEQVRAKRRKMYRDQFGFE